MAEVDLDVSTCEKPKQMQFIDEEDDWGECLSSEQL